MSKPKHCPQCREDISTIWCAERKLRYRCNDSSCGWLGEPFIPPRRNITNTKNLWLGPGSFPGWDYVVYDKRGYEMVLSRSYSSRSKALKELRVQLKCGKTDIHGGPYIGVLFHTPIIVKLRGKRYGG